MYVSNRVFFQAKFVTPTYGYIVGYLTQFTDSAKPKTYTQQVGLLMSLIIGARSCLTNPDVPYSSSLTVTFGYTVTAVVFTYQTLTTITYLTPNEAPAATLMHSAIDPSFCSNYGHTVTAGVTTTKNYNVVSTALSFFLTAFTVSPVCGTPAFTYVATLPASVPLPGFITFNPATREFVVSSINPGNIAAYTI